MQEGPTIRGLGTQPQVGIGCGMACILPDGARDITPGKSIWYWNVSRHILMQSTIKAEHHEKLDWPMKFCHCGGGSCARAHFAHCVIQRHQRCNIHNCLIRKSFTIRRLYSGFVQKSDCGFPDFSRTKLFLFPDFSRHFVHIYVNINITELAFKRWNLLYNLFFYSKYRMGLKFLKSELQMLCVMNCKKINKCIGNQQCNIHLYFPGNITVFKDFSRLFYTYDHFQDFSRPRKFRH